MSKNQKSKTPEFPALDISGAVNTYRTPIQEAQFYMMGKGSNHSAERPSLEHFMGDRKFGSSSKNGNSAPVPGSKKIKVRKRPRSAKPSR